MMALSEKYSITRGQSVEICQPLETEDYVVQPAEDVSPPKWHLAHTTWFWEEFLLAPLLPDYRRFHPAYSFLFNSYYNAVGDRVLRLDRGNMSRPTVHDIMNYRTHVDEHMLQLLQQNLSREHQALVELGINHEQQHQELLYTDIKYILGHNPLFPPYQSSFVETPGLKSRSSFINMPEGMYSIGHTGNGFAFDNESKAHDVYLPAFAISEELVSNAAFLEFIEAGGYSDPRWWHSDGWTWVKENDIHAPLYWHFRDGSWKRYALSGLGDLKAGEPVTHISFYEAAAFAEWKGMRLPTEFEWEAANEKFHWGVRWEHTNSAYLPYPGFSKPPGAIGEYNGKFMINQMVLRGASVATPQGHSRKTYRNFFQPHLRWQFNGIRLCKK